jgi:PAS domain S-box-containing protein
VRKFYRELRRMRLPLHQPDPEPATNDLFRSGFEQAAVGLAYLDLQGRFQRVNPRLCEMVGYSAAELLTKRFVDITHPDDVAIGIDYTEQLIQGQIPTFAQEKRYIRSDGTDFWAEVNVSLVRFSPNQHWFLATVINIDARKQAEQEVLRQSQAQLQQREEQFRSLTKTQFRESLQEKEVLLREIHHRVKNNMQVVFSLLSLQASVTQDPKVLAPLREIQNRIKVMLLVHDRFCQSKNLAHINFPDYVHSLVHDIVHSYSPTMVHPRLNLDIADVDLDIDAVIPCGLILHELVSNALKHAFPHPGDHQISIQFTMPFPQQFILTVADNGIGLPSHLDPQHTESLGLQIVEALAMKLRGTVKCTDKNPGTIFTIDFNLSI